MRKRRRGLKETRRARNTHKCPSTGFWASDLCLKLSKLRKICAYLKNISSCKMNSSRYQISLLNRVNVSVSVHHAAVASHLCLERTNRWVKCFPRLSMGNIYGSRTEILLRVESVPEEQRLTQCSFLRQERSLTRITWRLKKNLKSYQLLFYATQTPCSTKIWSTTLMRTICASSCKRILTWYAGTIEDMPEVRVDFAVIVIRIPTTCAKMQKLCSNSAEANLDWKLRSEFMVDLSEE